MSPAPRHRRVLYLNRRAPHGTIHAFESLEAVLAGSAFGQRLTLLFLDDGVFQLKRDQDPGALELKNFARAFRALEDHGVTRVNVCARSLEERGLGLADLLIPARALDDAAVARLMEQHAVVLSF